MLSQHPACANARWSGAACPETRRSWRSSSCATVRPRRPVELAAFAAERLAPYKQPAEIVVLPALPASSTGKVLKNALRERAQGPR